MIPLIPLGSTVNFSKPRASGDDPAVPFTAVVALS